MGFKIGKLIKGGVKLFSGDVSGALDVVDSFGGGGGGGGSGTSAQAPGFTPYGITSGFGTSNIDAAKKTATYTLTPEMKAFRDKYYAAATGAMTNVDDFGNKNIEYAKGLFDTATNMDIGAMTSDYYNKQLNLLEPGRAQESSRLNDLQFSRGTIGAGVGMGGGYVNPQQYALAMARENQNAQLAIGAEDRARSIQGDTLTRANALYGMGQNYNMQPYERANTLFGYGSAIENLGMGTMATGMNMGNIATTSNQNAADLNSNINQQNYLNALYKSNANADSWSDTLNNVNWGTLFGRGSDDGQWSSGGSYDPLGRN